MALTNTRTGTEVALEALRTFFHQKTAQMRDARTRRRIYKTTFHELSALSNRDLADLGIPRAHIRRLALEASHGA